MNQTEQTYQQLQARIDDLEAQYQTLQMQRIGARSFRRIR
ncbi:prefoldin subunit 5 [Pseudomonas frederiksbergensis]